MSTTIDRASAIGIGVVLAVGLPLAFAAAMASAPPHDLTDWERCQMTWERSLSDPAARERCDRAIDVFEGCETITIEDGYAFCDG